MASTVHNTRFILAQRLVIKSTQVSHIWWCVYVYIKVAQKSYFTDLKLSRGFNFLDSEQCDLVLESVLMLFGKMKKMATYNDHALTRIFPETPPHTSKKGHISKLCIQH